MRRSMPRACADCTRRTRPPRGRPSPARSPARRCARPRSSAARPPPREKCRPRRASPSCPGTGRYFASLPIEVVLPEPFTPATSSTKGLCAGDRAAACATGCSRSTRQSLRTRLRSAGIGDALPGRARARLLEQIFGRGDADVAGQQQRLQLLVERFVDLACAARAGPRAGRRACRASRTSPSLSAHSQPPASAALSRVRGLLLSLLRKLNILKMCQRSVCAERVASRRRARAEASGNLVLSRSSAHASRDSNSPRSRFEFSNQPLALPP